MNESEIVSLAGVVLAGIAPEADLATVGMDEDLREALDLDSMDVLNFIVGLGQRSGVAIAEADYPKVFTLAGLVRYLEQR